MPNVPSPDAALRLLELLASDVPLTEIASVDAPASTRDLALRIGSAREAHRQREAALTALLDTARELSTESDPAVVLEAVVRRTRALMRADVAYLTLYDPDAGDTYMRATSGSVSANFQSLRLASGDGLGGLVASTLKPYWTADYAADPRFAHTPAINGAVGEEGLTAICGTPLIVGEEFVGVLFAANRSPRPFTREDVMLLGNLATLAAVTLVQARSRREADRAFEQLSAAHEKVSEYAAGVEKAAAAHDRFASLVLGGGGVDDITHALGELLGGWAILFDESGGRRSAYGPVPEEPAYAGDDEIDPLVQTLGELATETGRLVDRDGVYAIAVTAGRESLGLLIVGGICPPSDPDRRTIERAAVVTALVLLFERNTADARQSARNRVMADLLTERGAHDDRVHVARSSGFDPERPFCVLVLRGEGPPNRRALVISASNASGQGSLVGLHEDDVVALVPGSDPDALARSLAARLGRRTPATVAGVGPLHDVSGLARAYDEGARTVRALNALGHKGRGAAARQLGFAGLIVGSDPDVRDYVTRVLGPVVDYDGRRGTDLVGTLRAYFASGSSPRHAAAELHVHVNTVSQRLERISALLGERWQEPGRALEIQLALRLRDLVADL